MRLTAAFSVLLVDAVCPPATEPVTEGLGCTGTWIAVCINAG